VTEQISDSVSLDIVSDVAVIRMDDGKANAMGHAAIEAVRTAFDRAADGARAVVWLGREGKFSAGFDLSIMAGDDPAAQSALLGAGARLCHRVYMHPQPVIAGCTGHALALGALLLASCDVRIGAEGPYKIGTSEVAIGMALPRFGVELARDRLSKRHFQVAVQHARVYDPAGAVAAGWLDEVTALDAVERTAIEHATELAATLHPGAFARTREYTRGAAGAAILAGLELDLA
jgi:enoyl-CoA hydratase